MSQTYLIRPGDNLWSISRENNTSVTELLKANPQINDPALIHPGERLTLPQDSFERTSPPSNRYTTVPPSAPALPSSELESNRENFYRVTAGDSLSQIARKNNLTLRQLLQANPQITTPNLIRPGQWLKIPHEHLASTPIVSTNPASTAAPLLEGHRGPSVTKLQNQLRQLGYSISIDGIFGPQTKEIVRSFQQSRGLIPDGVVGPETTRELNHLSLHPSPINSNQPSESTRGHELEVFPISGGQFNIGYDSNWSNFNSATAHHNSDYSLTATNASHPNGHLGVDIFGPRGAEVVSPVTGIAVSVRRNTSIGGNSVTIRRGNHYYYHAHLDSIPNSLRAGSPISAGTAIGTLGNTGSAQGTEPHLHFSIYQGANGYNSGTINPYPALKRALVNHSPS